MEHLAIGTLIIVGIFMLVVFLMKIPPRRSPAVPVPGVRHRDLPCRECGGADGPTRLYTWTRWSRVGRRYRQDFLCRACAHQWHAQPVEAVKSDRKVPS